MFTIWNGLFCSGTTGWVVTGIYGVNSTKKMFDDLKEKVSVYRGNPTDEHLSDVLSRLLICENGFILVGASD